MQRMLVRLELVCRIEQCLKIELGSALHERRGIVRSFCLVWINIACDDTSC
jgi:hypothetical protein